MRLFILLTCILIWSSCDIYKSLRYGGIPNQNDYVHFPQRIIQNESPTFYFEQSIDSSLGKRIGLPSRSFNSTNISLDAFVKRNKTIAFVIIRDDTIVYENYERGYTDTSMYSSFSAVKPMLSTLIGIAIEEKKIGSIDDRIVKYLHEFKSKPGWDKITIKNLLHHTSGIKYRDNKFSPTSDNAEFYWGNHLRNKVVTAELECPPDSIYRYSSENSMLLALIIERVTGNTLSRYLQERLWKPLGMESPATWSLDRKDSEGIEKAFCCLQARVLDYARFGRLYLHEGNWLGRQIVPQRWVDYSIHSDPSGHNKHFYNNNWGIGPLKYGSFFAAGLYGQYIYMYPEKNIIIVRFGKADLNYNPPFWESIFTQIIDQL